MTKLKDMTYDELRNASVKCRDAIWDAHTNGENTDDLLSRLTEIAKEINSR